MHAGKMHTPSLCVLIVLLFIKATFLLAVLAIAIEMHFVHHFITALILETFALSLSLSLSLVKAQKRLDSTKCVLNLYKLGTVTVTN